MGDAGTDRLDASCFDASHPLDAGAAPALADAYGGNDSVSLRGVGAEAPPVVPPAIAEVAVSPTIAQGDRHVGAGIDLGVSGILPDLGILAVYRPMRWFAMNVGAGFNGIAPGLRGGATVVNPFIVPLSLTLEAGHYFEGDANRLVRWVRSDLQPVAALRRFSYNFVNLMVGAEYTGTSIGVYARVGLSWMRTTITDFDDSVRESTHIDLQADDPRVSYRGPTAKLGTYFLF